MPTRLTASLAQTLPHSFRGARHFSTKPFNDNEAPSIEGTCRYDAKQEKTKLNKIARFTTTVAVFTMLPLAAVAAEDLPARKAGLWEITSTDNPFGNWITCIGKGKDNFVESDVWSDFEKECKVVSSKKTGAVQTLVANCEAAGTGKVKLNVEFSGDFEKQYSFKSMTEFKDTTGNLTQQIFNVKADYGGECPASLVPGQKQMKRP